MCTCALLSCGVFRSEFAGSHPLPTIKESWLPGSPGHPGPTNMDADNRRLADGLRKTKGLSTSTIDGNMILSDQLIQYQTFAGLTNGVVPTHGCVPPSVRNWVTLSLMTSWLSEFDQTFWTRVGQPNSIPCIYCIYIYTYIYIYTLYDYVYSSMNE